jgi:hypothetical protein
MVAVEIWSIRFMVAVEIPLIVLFWCCLRGKKVWVTCVNADTILANFSTKVFLPGLQVVAFVLQHTSIAVLLRHHRRMETCIHIKNSVTRCFQFSCSKIWELSRSDRSWRCIGRTSIAVLLRHHRRMETCIRTHQEFSHSLFSILLQ